MKEIKLMKVFNLTLDNEHTFSISYFHEEPILDVLTIEERIKAMNLHRVSKIYMTYNHKNMNNRWKFLTKRTKQFYYKTIVH